MTLQDNYSVNHQRQPLEGKEIKADYVCPTCKQQLWFNDAINDGTNCDCGVWWYKLSPSVSGTSLHKESGWHFKATGISNNKRTPNLSRVSPPTTLQDKLDEILRSYGVDHINDTAEEEATQAILTDLEAWVTSAMPEKREEKLYTTTVVRTGREWNEALDQYHTKLMEGLKL